MTVSVSKNELKKDDLRKRDDLRGFYGTLYNKYSDIRQSLE
jgi:hypothetical protein